MSNDLEDLFKEIQEYDTPDERIDLPDSPLETITVDASPRVVEPVVVETPASPIELGAYVRKMEKVTDDVLQACEKDRAEIQEVVDLMFGEIRVDQEAGRNPSRAYTDNLTKLLEVKSNVNMIAVKMMETNVKMLAATKAGAITVNQNNMNVATGGDDLKRLLAEPMAPTDEY